MYFKIQNKIIILCCLVGILLSTLSFAVGPVDKDIDALIEASKQEGALDPHAWLHDELRDQEEALKALIEAGVIYSYEKIEKLEEALPDIEKIEEILATRYEATDFGGVRFYALGIGELETKIALITNNQLVEALSNTEQASRWNRQFLEESLIWQQEALEESLDLISLDVIIEIVNGLWFELGLLDAQDLARNSLESIDSAEILAKLIESGALISKSESEKKRAYLAQEITRKKKSIEGQFEAATYIELQEPSIQSGKIESKLKILENADFSEEYKKFSASLKKLWNKAKLKENLSVIDELKYSLFEKYLYE